MKNYLYSLRFLFSIHIAGLLLLSLFRLILFFRGTANLGDESGEYLLQSEAFLRGLWFDNVVACYILLLPLAVASISAWFGYYGARLYRGLTIFMGIMYGITFAISASDIPYFEYFFKHLNASIFNWMGYGETTLKMMFGEPAYRWPIFFFVVAVTIFSVFLRRMRKLTVASFEKNRFRSWKSVGGIVVSTALTLWACMFGIRGRMGYNPIRVSAAYYCNNTFLNQLGINPTFNLLRSTLESTKKENKSLRFMNEKEAIENVREFLAIEESFPDISPIARTINADTSFVRKNVVLVLMQSMSGKFMERYGDKRGLTPFLDSLAGQATCFDRFYSAGTHTNHGLYATLYGYPAMMKKNLMKGAVIPFYTGLPRILQENGYRTLFFMTHESQYDNMNGFLRSNGYDEIYAQENYPSEKVVNSFGVQDDFLYEYAIPVLTERSASVQPFFATLLSISNHPPYIIPPYFKPHSKETEEQIVEYADWSLRKFMDEASRQPWYENTIFVFLADHGKLVGSPKSDMPLTYHHIPLIIYEPGQSPRKSEVLGGQIDVGPTILGMLGISYINNMFGIDLFRQNRSCILFTSDDAVGCMDRDYFYIYRPGDEQEWLFKVQDGEEGSAVTNDTIRNKLRNYAFSVLQTAQSIIDNEETGKYKGYVPK